jgi:hypothetical protein
MSRNALSWARVAAGISTQELPTETLEAPASRGGTAAILSWRWDRDPITGRSRNLALALKHGREMGLQHLLVDIVSIDQTLPKPLLLRSVVDLANLFASIPVIAAYDEEEAIMDAWSRTLQRPWILSEIRAYCQNPTRVTYVGYRHCSDRRRTKSFANEVSMIRSAGYAACILEILCGRVQMTDVADFAQILAEFAEPVEACHATFSRADYLLAVFLLTARYERGQAVSRVGRDVDYGFRMDVGDPMFDRVGLTRFAVGPFLEETAPYESARALTLDGQQVAVWRSKMTSSYDRNWIEVLPDAEDHIFRAVNLPPEACRSYKERSGLRTAFLRIDKAAPTPAIGERAACLARGRWLQKVPAPQATSVGFNPDLWR